jgi:DNA repair protein RadA/Sms
MTRLRTVHRCRECAASQPKWSGRCPGCGAWNSLDEEVEEISQPSQPAALARAWPSALARPITLVAAADGRPEPTGVPELDRVLGGGLVPGSVTLVGGEPGVGKSTLLLQVAAARATGGQPVLYVSAEESAQQVRNRAERLGALVPDLWMLSETQMPAILAAVEEVGPAVVVVDSIQTVVDPELGSSPGSVVQVRECAQHLVQEARGRGVAVLLVGHVTKEGQLAGPRVLEHVVDTVLTFEGDAHHALRMLTAVKHRYGSTNELGLFEMEESGLVGVADASGMFLADRTCGVAGSMVVPIVEGHRPILVEVQALVVPSGLPAPRRSAQGLDHGRLGLLVAVLQNRAGLPFRDLDVYASVVGGVRLTEPGSDLGICLALASALTGVALDAGLVASAEVGLAGELRQVAQTPRRLAEAARMGFERAIVPQSAPDAGGALEVVRVQTVAEAIEAAGIVPRETPTSIYGRTMRATGPNPDGSASAAELSLTVPASSTDHWRR